MNIYAFYNKPEELDEFQRIMSTDPEMAHDYAIHSNKPFPEGEAAIATNARYAADYAMRIIKGRWLPGEAAIAQHHGSAYTYARYALRDRFPAGEAIINTSKFYSGLYNDFVRTLNQ